MDVDIRMHVGQNKDYPDFVNVTADVYVETFLARYMHIIAPTVVRTEAFEFLYRMADSLAVRMMEQRLVEAIKAKQEQNAAQEATDEPTEAETREAGDDIAY